MGAVLARQGRSQTRANKGVLGALTHAVCKCDDPQPARLALNISGEPGSILILRKSRRTQRRAAIGQTETIETQTGRGRGSTETSAVQKLKPRIVSQGAYPMTRAIALVNASVVVFAIAEPLVRQAWLIIA